MVYQYIIALSPTSLNVLGQRDVLVLIFHRGTSLNQAQKDWLGYLVTAEAGMGTAVRSVKGQI
jgi:hypothetical protein